MSSGEATEDGPDTTAPGPSGLPYRPCAGVVLINRDGLVFAGQRIDNPGPAWQMPQGGIDPDEAPLAAALRELGEETGVGPELVEVLSVAEDWVLYDLPPELLGRMWGGRFGGQRQKWVLMRFLGDDTQIDIATPQAEFSRWAWMRADDLIGRIVPFKRDVYARVFQTFRDWLA